MKSIWKITLKGFSLIEVLIAIAIIALIAVVSIPLFSMGLRSVESSENNTEELFEIQSKIENRNTTPLSGNTQIKFIFSGKEVSVPIKHYRISARDIEQGSSKVSIYYFEYDN